MKKINKNKSIAGVYYRESIAKKLLNTVLVEVSDDGYFSYTIQVNKKGRTQTCTWKSKYFIIEAIVKKYSKVASL